MFSSLKIVNFVIQHLWMLHEAPTKRSQHIATLLGATRCARLATLLRRVFKFENSQFCHTTFVDVT